MNFVELHDKFALKIEGIDLSKPISDSVYSSIRKSFDDYGVLVFPNQTISATQQQQFAEMFGGLESFPEQSMQKQSPKVYNVSNVTDSGKLVGKNSMQARMLKGTELGIPIVLTVMYLHWHLFFMHWKYRPKPSREGKPNLRT